MTTRFSPDDQTVSGPVITRHAYLRAHWSLHPYIFIAKYTMNNDLLNVLYFE
jgi:hypothetical protein